MKRIQIDKDIQQLLLSHAVELNEAPSDILRRELGLAPPPDTIEIEDDVYRFLVSKAVSLSESPSSILRRVLKLDGDHQHPAPAVVEFQISPGTAGSPWNSRETAVAATVGDTLRIVNDDSVAHRPHTNGAPFAHPAVDIASLQTAEFLLEKPYDLAAAGPLSDHLFGPAAQFFINVQPAG
jgi:hypothetical protein